MAFESLCCKGIFKAINNEGIDKVCINMIKDNYTKSAAQIQIHVLSREIDLKLIKEARQGDAL